MKSDYQLTPQAAADLVEIWQYTKETWGEVQAAKYTDEIEQAILRLAGGEVTGRPCINLVARHGAKLRYWRAGKHYIIHRQFGDGPLQILTILHSASQGKLDQFLGESAE